MDRMGRMAFLGTCVLTSLFFLLSANPLHAASSGYFQLHNLMSAAQKSIPSGLYYNDALLTLEATERGSGHVVNTQFSNNGGMAGCGVTSTMMAYMYQNASPNLSNNYIALNVYSQINGFDPNAPFWGDPEGMVKGYLTQGSNIAYPYTPYHRQIPSIYPSLGGLYNNGLNCGRWVEADFDTQFCQDRTSATGISKYCPGVTGLTYAGQKIQAYVFDSCEDNNGWCRDDAAHLDVNPLAFTSPNNYYLQWKFITNPYYSNATAPAALKDVWLAWFSEASKYWSYVAILNAENGISAVEYNIGSLTGPTWIGSHVLGGSNDVTWSSTSNNGQLWQVEPVNALTDAAPASNPTYQMRLFDVYGYPANHGAIYQFELLFQDGTLGQSVSGYYFFYQGGSTVKTGSQPQNMTILAAPTGAGQITVNFNQLLPSNVSLDATQSSYLRPVVITNDGYSYDPSSCTQTQCVYTSLPTGKTFYVFAHAIEDVSNDLTLRKVNDVGIHSATVSFPGSSTSATLSLQSTDINLSTLYSARIQIPLQFATTSNTAINGNLQALFVPNASKNAANNITAQTQGCFLDTYVNTNTGSPTWYGNYSTCTVYYTVNNQSAFPTTTTPPTAYFNVLLPLNVGISPVSYSLASAYNNPVQVTGYNPATGALPVTVPAPVANYGAGTGSSRSLYLILDPNSDASCLQNLNPVLGVSISVGGTAFATLATAGTPVETQISAATGNMTATANMVSGSSVSCVPMFAIVPSSNPLQPGTDVIDVIKLVAQPVATPPAPTTQGIAATATGATPCLGATDTLIFSSNGSVAASAPWTTSATATNVGVNASAGTYTVSDSAFNVPGGSCKLASTLTVTLQSNTYTPVTLNYQYTQTPGSTCSATATVTGTWEGGCTIQFALTASTPLSNVSLSWAKGAWNWNNVQIWSGQGSLVIPSGSTGNVSWALPSWVNAQGSSVGMNIQNDTTPLICSAFGAKSIIIGCSGIAT